MTLQASTTRRGPGMDRTARRAAIALAAAGALALAGCGGTPLAPPDTPTASGQLLPLRPAAAAAALPPYVFAIGDEFDLRVPDAPQFDQTLKVRPDGKVSLALVGSVYAQGRTPEDVEGEIRERLHALGGAPGAREYLLQPNDEIEVKFPYTPALNEAQRIRPDGKIQMQEIGTVVAEGLSPEELQQRLKAAYARVLRHPELSVIVRSVTTQNVRVSTAAGPVTARAGLGALEPTLIVRTTQAPQVFVTGEVGKPGVLAWRPGFSLVQALAEAGGALPTGDGAHIVVLRRGAGAPGQPEAVQVLRLDLPRDFARQPDRDVALQPFDVVLLPRSDIAVMGDKLNAYVLNLLPPLKNSSFGFVYDLSSSNSIIR
ncbi:MAG: polysaccharide biosynthesis/export family protein [Burkholderiaceae bacterium]